MELDSQNLQQGLDRVNRQIPFLKSVFERLQSFKRITEDNFYDVCTCSLHLIEYIPFLAPEIAYDRLVRARRNIDGEVFSEQSDISYNIKRQEQITLGRFNRPGEPIFYGAIPTGNNASHFVITSAIETCKELLNDMNNDPYLDFTIGLWHFTKKIRLVILNIEDEHLSYNNESINTIIKHGIEGIKKVASPEAFDLILNVWKFFSQLSCAKPDESNYAMSTAFFCAIRVHYENAGHPVFGILYPSAQTEKKGINIALTKEAVDSSLYLKHVVMHRFKRKVGRKEFDCYPCSNLANVYNGKFHFDWIGENFFLTEIDNPIIK